MPPERRYIFPDKPPEDTGPECLGDRIRREKEARGLIGGAAIGGSSQEHGAMIETWAEGDAWDKIQRHKRRADRLRGNTRMRSRRAEAAVSSHSPNRPTAASETRRPEGHRTGPPRAIHSKAPNRQRRAARQARRSLSRTNASRRGKAAGRWSRG
jgi:hypothetical protein